MQTDGVKGCNELLHGQEDEKERKRKKKKRKSRTENEKQEPDLKKEKEREGEVIDRSIDRSNRWYEWIGMGRNHHLI